MPQIIEDSAFHRDSADFLYNNENDSFLKEFQFVLSELKKSVDLERYKKLPDLIKPQ